MDEAGHKANGEKGDEQREQHMRRRDRRLSSRERGRSCGRAATRELFVDGGQRGRPVRRSGLPVARERRAVRRVHRAAGAARMRFRAPEAFGEREICPLGGRVAHVVRETAGHEARVAERRTLRELSRLQTHAELF